MKLPIVEDKLVTVGDDLVVFGVSATVLAITPVCLVLLLNGAAIPIIVNHECFRVDITLTGTYKYSDVLVPISFP